MLDIKMTFKSNKRIETENFLREMHDDHVFFHARNVPVSA